MIRAVQPNAWNQRRWPGQYPAGWRRGFFTGQRKLNARAFLPGPRERAAAAGPDGTVEPYWHVMNFTPLSRESLDDQVLPDGDVALLALMATTNQGGQSFQAQFFQVMGDREGHRWSRAGVNRLNLFGTAGRPFLLRRPYFAPDLMPLMCRVANAATLTNTIQVVLLGVRRRVSA